MDNEGSSPAFEEQLPVRRPNGLLLALAALPVAAAAALLVARLLGGDEALPLVAANLCLLGAFALVGALRGRPLATVTTERVRVDGEAIHVGGARVPLARVTRAVHLHGRASGVAMVRVERRLGLALELLVGGPSEAERLLAALGHGPGQRVVTFRALSRLMTPVGRFLVYPLLLALIGASLGGALPVAAVTVGLTVAVVLLLLLLVPTRADVGADGLLVRWAGTRRFVPWSEVAYTSRFTESWGRYLRHGLRVYVADAAPVELVCGARGAGDDEASALDARIQAHLGAAPRGDRDVARAALARDGRATDAWLRHLRALGAGGASGFRHAPPSPEQILGVLESAADPAEARAAAAVALAAAPDGSRERVRVVAAAVADPRLRAALDAATGDDEGAVTRALDALDRGSRERG